MRTGVALVADPVPTAHTHGTLSTLVEAIRESMTFGPDLRMSEVLGLGLGYI